MGGLGNDIFGNQGGGFMPDVGSSTSTPDKKVMCFVDWLNSTCMIKAYVK